MNGGRGIEKGCLLVFFVKVARTAIVNVLTVLETQNLEPNRTILFSPGCHLMNDATEEFVAEENLNFEKVSVDEGVN
jgi:hypothetical protein